MARAMLGLWEKAGDDLYMASKLDFDDEIDLVLKKVILCHDVDLIFKFWLFDVMISSVL